MSQACSLPGALMSQPSAAANMLFWCMGEDVSASQDDSEPLDLPGSLIVPEDR